MSARTAGIGFANSHFAAALWRSRALISIALAYTAAAYAISRGTGVPFESGTFPQLGAFATIFTPAFLAFLAAYRLLYTAFVIRPAHLTQHLIADIHKYCLDQHRIVTGLVAFSAVMTVTGSFVFLKELIPVLNPFSWDPTFAEIDRMVHGGRDAYEILLPALQSPLMTTALNAVYHSWFVLLFFVVYTACFDCYNPERRNTFLIAFALTWIVSGTILATVFSSVGPVYYDAFGFGDDFAPLMQLLRNNSSVSPVWALDMQDALLSNYRTDGPVKGISAMPSMHVTSSALLAIYGFAWRRWAGYLLTLFALVILIGSVHLGWHYAIDGYFGAAIAVPCWYVGKALARRFA